MEPFALRGLTGSAASNVAEGQNSKPRATAGKKRRNTVGIVFILHKNATGFSTITLERQAKFMRQPRARLQPLRFRASLQHRCGRILSAAEKLVFGASSRSCVDKSCVAGRADPLDFARREGELPVAKRLGALENQGSFPGVLAQLVERLKGSEEVRGSNPLGSSLCSPPEAQRRLSRRSLGEGGPL
jgi:hypothetical protein